MTTRRQFLRGSLGILAGAGVCLAFPGDNPPAEAPETLPDGSASRNMIDKTADEAIERGLAYLATNQHPDGSFGLHAARGNVAVTSLGALALMAGGHQPNRGAYGAHVTNALRFVLKQENREGTFPGFLHNPDAPIHGPMYSHGFGTLFLAEAYGMVHDRELRKELDAVLHRAVQLILDGQNIEGGWRYFPNSKDADLSVTICQIMALRAARNAGINVPRKQVDRCVEYVKGCQNRREGWFRYMRQGGGGSQQGFARTAAGVVALYSAGIYKGPEIDRALAYLNQFRPDARAGWYGRGGLGLDMHYFYGHYYAVQAMYTAGGTYWKEWYPAIRDALVSNQDPTDGSWHDHVDQHYATAMACLILQVPNNYLPILQK